MADNSNKNNIIESWIMVEGLVEGDMDKKALHIKSIQDDNYYDLFMEEMGKKQIGDKGGIIIFFDVFPFQEVIDILTKMYKISLAESDVNNNGDKFSFVLCFDKKLKIDPAKTFFTESYYIRQHKKIPEISEFGDFEQKYKNQYNNDFAREDVDDYKKYFNETMSSIIKDKNIKIENCRMQIVKNLETDYGNLHSFFKADLEYAKNIKDNILDTYVLGNTLNRTNLDSKTKTDDESLLSAQIFSDILQPKNYPVARFPSDTRYSLSFMQQVAVNIAIGVDNQKVRSVNGPPGTGKTTLLKDIFAELVVRQALEITKLSDKLLKGTKETIYFDKASIGVMLESIAEKGIVVASSNNGAVQNIVNDLPLFEEIKNDELKKYIIEADYFKEIATQNAKKSNNSAKESWGLFSLEGGKKANMDNIENSLKSVYEYLDKEYKSNEKIYDEFLKEYEKVKKYRDERQRVVDDLKEMAKIKEINKELRDIDKQILNKEKDKDKYEGQIKALMLQKPSWYIMIFSCLKRTKEYNFALKGYSDILQNLIQEKYDLENKKDIQCEEIQNRLKKIKFYKKENDIKSCDDIEQVLQTLQEKINEDKMALNINELDLGAEYKTLQLSNPWFNEEYRILQSRLFISALKVRKQFLYDNRKNVKAAYNIYSNGSQNNKLALLQAWNWTNMVVPVISSTFASFSRMCSGMDEIDKENQTTIKPIGHLFIDEAGQALPWASIGAIFRSKNVMVVGDPAQIKPVLSLNPAVLTLIGKIYDVPLSYLSEDASTQTLVDKISQYGFYKNDEEWIGIPLWVHRRCRHPMFDISNIISYDGNMVQGIKKDNSIGKAEWLDVSGVANEKYVKEQGEFLKNRIKEMISVNSDINNKEKEDLIYVITPFKNIEKCLSYELDSIGFTRKDDKGKATNIGTVHKFQGKEAPIVFLVLGADKKSEAAARWAVNSPNIMNVAATRAKEEFYIIGDKELYLGLKENVIKYTYETIDNFNK